MTDRERLIELINQVDFDYGEECVACSEDGYKCRPDMGEFFADYLLANGVIVPPCKVGDTVYYIYWLNGLKIGSGTIEEIYYNGDGFAYHICHDYNYFDLQQEDAFLTKEEAEQALKEREKV